MGHNEVFKMFKIYVPKYAELSTMWFPCGKNAIRIRLENRQEYVFTYHSMKNWSFETIDSFIKNKMKKGNKS